MANISFEKFLYFATLIYTATFKPGFQLAECQFFNLFFAHTDAGNIIRREIDFSSSFAMLLWIFTARVVKPRFGATSGFFWNRCIEPTWTKSLCTHGRAYIRWRVHVQFQFSCKISVAFSASSFCLSFGNVKIILNKPNSTSSLWLLQS